MAKLESLIVDLKLNTAELRKGIDDANKKIESLGAKVAKLSGTLNFSIVANAAKQATVALVNFVKHGAETADAMGKMADATGVSVEEFSRLQYAAQLGGVGVEEFSGALNKLNKNISEAASGGKEQAALFKALGVAVKDSGGNTRSTDAIFLDLADAFNKLGPGADKARLQMELFGKQGARFESVFKGGAAGIKELGAEADRLGITISSKTAAAAEEFNDNFERMELALTRVGANVAGEVAPAFTQLTDFLLKSEEGAKLLKGAVTVLSNVMKVLASVVIGVGAAFDVVGTAIAGTAAQFVEIFKGNFKGAAEIGNQMNADIKKSIATAGKLLDAVWTDAASSSEDSSKKMQKSAGDVTKKVKELTDNIAELKKQSQFELKMKIGKIDTGAAERTKRFENIGQVPALALADAAGQFKTFGQALSASTEARVQQETLLARAADARGKKDFDLARRLTENAERFGELASSADKAADALEQTAQRAFEEAEAKAQSDFELKRTSEEIDRGATRRVQDFAARTQTPRERASGRTQGFGSFEQAVQASADATKKAAMLRAQAEEASRNGLNEWSRSLTESADAAALAAEKANEAAAGFEELADLDAASFKAKVEGIMQGLAAVGLQFVSKLGELGQVINAGIQGFQTGGVWGAIIAVIIELLAKFERFQEVMDLASGLVENAIGDMMSGFNSLIDGIKPLLGAIGMIFEAVHGILNPILELIGDVLGGLAPIFAILGLVMKPLGALFKSLAGVIGTVLMPILKGLAYVFIGIGLVMSGLQIAVAAVWLALVTAGDEILKAFGNKSLSGARDSANQALKDNIKAAEDLAKTDPDKLMKMAEASADNAKAIGKEKREREENTKKIEKTSNALDRLSAQFTNVPEGFRLAWRQFGSQDTQMNPTSLGGGGGSTVIVMGTLVTEREVQNYVANGQAKRNWQRDGKWKP